MNMQPSLIFWLQSLSCDDKFEKVSVRDTIFLLEYISNHIPEDHSQHRILICLMEALSSMRNSM